MLVTFALSAPCRAIDLDEAEQLLLKGEYEKCLTAADKGIEAEPFVEGWWLLKLKSQLEMGKYPEASQVMRRR